MKYLVGRQVNPGRGEWKRKGLVPLFGGLVCVLALTAMAAENLADTAGLKGILPAEIPEPLENAIGALQGNWKKWSDETLDELAKLYASEGLDVSGQRALLEKLKKRLGTIKTSLNDPAYVSIYDQLAGAHGALSRRLAIIEAILDTLGQNAATAKAEVLENARKELADATDAADKWLAPMKNGEIWVRYLQLTDLKELTSPAGEAKEGKIIQVSHQTVVPQWDHRHVTDPEVKAFLKKPEIVRLEKATAQYSNAVAVASHAADPKALREQLTALVTNLELYEAEGLSTAAKGVREAWKGVRAAAADGGAKIDAALRPNYFSYNMEIAATEGFVSRMISERRVENGEVRDYICGADVFGNQVTNTDWNIDFLPTQGAVRFNINLAGTVNSSTDGYTDRAMIHTEGTHTFTSSKEAKFDGKVFSASPAVTNVNAYNNPTYARVKGGNVPFIGAIGEDTALGRARNLRPQTEAIAASRVRDRVEPRFNSEVDDKFKKATDDFDAKIVQRLKQLGEYPDVVDYQTTDDYVEVASRLMEAGELGGYVPHRSIIAREGMTLMLHESVINNSIDRLGIGGKTMTEDELRNLVQERLSKLLDRDVKIEKSAPTPADNDASAPKAMILDAKDPLRVKIDGGKVTVVFRAGFKRDGKEDIPPQIVSIPLNVEVGATEISVTRGDVSVSALGASKGAEQVILSGVVRKKFESSFSTKKASKETTIKKMNDKEEKVTVTSVKAIDGWLCITLN
ncbi:MAG: hypothetical protein U0903_09635 [Planctomycetales bacterium]